MPDVCLSLTELSASLGPLLTQNDVIEVRADHLADRLDEVLAFPSSCPVPCLFTWRSPQEGGAGAEMPPGICETALGSGYTWVDIELSRLQDGNRALSSVPAEQRWISSHVETAPNSDSEAAQILGQFEPWPGYVHKLVLRANNYDSVSAILDLLGRCSEDEQKRILFCQDDAGHPSRILGALKHNAYTFCSLPGRATAPGQPDLETLMDLYRFREFGPETKVFGVVGSQASSSLSPVLHNRALRSLGVNGVYVPIQTAHPDAVWRDLARGRFQGLSVTAPFKSAALAQAQHATQRAEAVGAANTIWLDSRGQVRADNTDAVAAAQLLQEFPAENGKVTILGSGGAARACASAAAGLGRGVQVCARNADEARVLCRRFNGTYLGPPDAWFPDDSILVNTTPIINPVWEVLSSFAGILDLTYDSTSVTGWERSAAAQSIPFISGKQFLRTQAVEQVRIFTGLEFSIDSMAQI